MLVEDEPRLRTHDPFLLARLRDEFVDATGVGGVDDEDDVLFARELPDKVNFLPLGHSFCNLAGADIDRDADRTSSLNPDRYHASPPMILFY